MKNILDMYSIASGQRINFDKSLVCFSTNVPQQTRNEVVNILEVSQGETHGKYLGLPSLVGRNKKTIQGFLKDKILNRVRSWNSKFLSRAGREVLLKNVLQALPCYAMMVFLLPVGLCREIEIALNEYWWTGMIGNGKGMRWRSWNGLSVPKCKGGLGFRRLREMNLALLGKQAWRLITKPDSLLARVLKSKYYPQCSFLDATMRSNPSFIWQGLMEVQNVLKRGCRRSIGNIMAGVR